VGRIVISENVTLDGVVEDPTGEEGFRHGGWFAQVTENDRDAWAGAAFEEAREAEALLFGRRSYEFFAARWPSRTGPFADRLNGMPKYVVSGTLEDPGWTNSRVLGGDAAAAVAGLRRELEGDIVLYASFGLVEALTEAGLVDELRLTIFPFVLGTGRRLFGEIGDKKPLRLVRTATLGDGLAQVVYQPRRDA
jgi:dihydrofolate reductase